MLSKVRVERSNMLGALDGAGVCAGAPSFEIDALSSKFFGHLLCERRNVCRNVHSSCFERLYSIRRELLNEIEMK